MKKIFLASCFFCFAMNIVAQTPQVPTGTPGERQLPIPTLKPLAPPDLIVTVITFVSIVLNPDTKKYTIRIIATTKNNGQVQSAKTQLEAYTKKTSGSWTLMGSAGNVRFIDPGKIYSAVYTFTGSALAIGSSPFEFRVKTDSGNFVAESDETNNYSETIVITPSRH